MEGRKEGGREGRNEIVRGDVVKFERVDNGRQGQKMHDCIIMCLVYVCMHT